MRGKNTNKYNKKAESFLPHFSGFAVRFYDHTKKLFLFFQLLQVEMYRGRRFEAHSLADLPDGGGVTVIPDKLDDDFVDPLLHIRFSSHSRTSAVFVSIPQFAWKCNTCSI